MRFCKQSLAEYIATRLEALAIEFGEFDWQDGWAQVENDGTARAAAYGEGRALLDIMQEFELPS